MKEDKISGVPTINQHPEMPTGCEATALTMLLNWHGLDMTNHEIVRLLPKGDSVTYQGDTWRGANPNIEFVGDPYKDEGSFGVFEGPILDVIEQLLPGQSVDLTGRSFDELLTIVRSGTPVMAWTTIHQQETFHSKTWFDDDGNEINWFRYEHAAVITGVDGDKLIVNDPSTGQEEHYDRDLFEKNWASMNKRAVTLKTS